MDGLAEHYVGNVTEVLELIQSGEKFRSVSSTGMNAVSSRSHSVVILTLEQKFKEGSSKTAKLNLVDLVYPNTRITQIFPEIIFISLFQIQILVFFFSSL